MTTIKSYTDIPQSKKLAEILPIKSADMMWKKELKQRLYSDEYKVSEPDFMYFLLFRGSSIMIQNFDIPCWSLAMLLRILSDAAANIDEDGYVDAVVCKDICSITLINCDDKFEKADNLVDACVAMIEKLNELNLL